MSFEFPNIEENKDNSGVDQERERQAEKIADERGSIFASIIDRVIRIPTGRSREELGHAIADEVSEYGDQPYVRFLKKVPVVGQGIKSWEGALGKDFETGEKLTSKDSMIRYGIGAAGAMMDVIKLIKPDFTLVGKTGEFLMDQATKAEEENPEGTKAKILRPIADFMDANSDEVRGFEKKIDDALSTPTNVENNG